MNRGFTLLELAIVLAIIGLIAGGIVAGSAMIRAGELRKVTTSIDEFRIAITSFQNKYQEIPGDTIKATRIWGEADPTPATCKTTIGVGTETCNGNDNGRVDYADDYAGSAERFRFWQHLANAKFLKGKYTGVTGSGSTHHAVPGENTPEIISGVAAHVYRRDSGSTYWFDSLADGKDFFVVGAEFDFSAPVTPAFSAEEVWSIDKKIDDGKPAKGNVMVGLLGDCTDASGSSDSESDYDLNDAEAIECIIVFRNLY